MFPYLDFQHCLNKAIDQYKYHLFTYGDALGLETLRRTLVSHLAEYQVFAKAESILITSGIQQALEILARMPFPSGRTEILVEQPGYDIYLRYLEAEGLPVSGIGRSAAGINLQELEERFASGRFKFFIRCPGITTRLGQPTAQRNARPLPAWQLNTMSTSPRMIIWRIWGSDGVMTRSMRMTRPPMSFISKASPKSSSRASGSVQWLCRSRYWRPSAPIKATPIPRCCRRLRLRYTSRTGCTGITGTRSKLCTPKNPRGIRSAWAA